MEDYNSTLLVGSGFQTEQPEYLGPLACVLEGRNGTGGEFKGRADFEQEKSEADMGYGRISFVELEVLERYLAGDS